MTGERSYGGRCGSISSGGGPTSTGLGASIDEFKQTSRMPQGLLSAAFTVLA